MIAFTGRRFPMVERVGAWKHARMTRRAANGIALALVLGITTAGCSERRSGGGTILRGRDAGPRDFGPFPDTGVTFEDAGPEYDGSTPPPDGGTNPPDAGPPPPDAGMGPPVCPTISPEEDQVSCSDACDNDGNGFADCNDFSCCGWRTDCAAGTTCGDAPQLCVEKRDENTLGRCTNQCDDDSDLGEPRFADCEDRSCCLIRQAGGLPCPSGSYCADQFMPRTQLCPGDDVTQEPARESTLAACSNVCDDDRNGYDDCSDRGCCAIRIAGGAPCPTGTYCADQWVPGEAVLCPSDDVTQPPATESDAVSCSDGCDNDRNGFQDCNDRNCCAARTDCPAGTYCAGP